MAERWKDHTEHYLHELRDAGEHAWGATRRGVATAGRRAAQMGRLVHHRLDLAALDRRLEARHAQLGRTAAAAWREGSYDLRGSQDAVRVLTEIEDLERERYGILREMGRTRATAGSRRAAEPGDQATRAEDPEEERHL